MKRAIIGGGGFARQVKAQMQDTSIPFFVDDDYFFEQDSTYPLSSFNHSKYEVLIAIGNPYVRNIIVKKLPRNTKYFTFIHQSAQIFENVVIGKGSVISAGAIITCNCSIGDHSIINLNTSISHDSNIGQYFTTAPGVVITGNNEIGDFVSFGANSSSKEKIKICSNVTIGMNAGVIDNIIDSGVYIGTPAKRIKV